MTDNTRMNRGDGGDRISVACVLAVRNRPT